MKFEGNIVYDLDVAITYDATGQQPSIEHLALCQLARNGQTNGDFKNEMHYLKSGSGSCLTKFVNISMKEILKYPS